MLQSKYLPFTNGLLTRYQVKTLIMMRENWNHHISPCDVLIIPPLTLIKIIFSPKTTPPAHLANWRRKCYDLDWFSVAFLPCCLFFPHLLCEILGFDSVSCSSASASAASATHHRQDIFFTTRFWKGNRMFGISVLVRCIAATHCYNTSILSILAFFPCHTCKDFLFFKDV